MWARIGGRNGVRNGRIQAIIIIGLLMAITLFLVLYFKSSRITKIHQYKSNSLNNKGGIISDGDNNWKSYSDIKYAFQQTYTSKYSNPSINTYSIAIISDKDQASKNEKYWESELMIGTLTRDLKTGLYSINWDKTLTLQSQLNENGRAMELSELLYFNNKLFGFDDRTGVVSEIDIDKKLAIPTYILMEGNGHTNKGQKTEWATAKDGIMYVGSIGKEWTNNKGELLHYNPQWIKMIDNNGRIKHVDWRPVYEKMREATGTISPGYMIHEAVCWNTEQRRWYFFPRRVGTEAYDDVADEERCSNLMISLDEHFQQPAVSRIGPLEKTHGFSSCKFIPFRENEIVLLKTMEYKGEIASYITVINLDGKVLLPEKYISNIKFEGVEFI